MEQRVHFLRHGETHNPDKIVYGARPFPLTEVGAQQAFEAGNYLSSFNSEAVFTSPVFRAWQTATLAAQDKEIFLDAKLTEAISIFDGRKITDVVAEKASWPHLFNPYGPSWGEAYTSIVHRMNHMVSTALRFGFKDVVLVSHQLPIWVYRLHAEGRSYAHDPLSRECGHASVTTMTYENGAVNSIKYWNNPIH